MYDETLEVLNKKFQVLQGKTLAALADGKTAEYDSLNKEGELLQKKIKAQEKVVEEKSAAERKNRMDAVTRTVNTRLQHSRDGLASLDCADKKIEVWQGWNTEKLEFGYEELLQKMNTILREKKTCTFGDRYSGKLSVTATKQKTTFSYHFYNREEKSFVLEVSNTETLDRFMKSLTLISCKTEPEIEHGVGHSPITEAYFLYHGEEILRDLFQSFADALYKKDD